MSGSILPDVADGASISDADLFYSTQSGVDKKVTGAQIKAYATPPGTSALIASAIGVDLNTADDTAMTLSAFATGKFFVVEWCIATNADAVLTTVQAGIFSGAGATGQIYGGNSTLPLTDPRDWQTIPGSNTLSGGSLSTMQNTVPFVNVGTPEGAPATADFYVYGRVFP